jgi:arylsulfatase A-like enzyme
MGHTFFETPVLDRLASQGMYFTNAYAPAANCAPSRASMLTGRWSTRHKIYSVESRSGIRENALLDIIETPIFKTTLEPSVDNIGRRLAEAGYYTSTLGKFHAGEDPVNFGFDSNVAGSSEGKPPTYYSPFKIKNLRVKTPSLHLNDVLASYAIGEIKAAQLSDQPFFVLLSHFAVHTPMEPPKDLLEKYKNKVGAEAEWVEYAAMLEGMDRATGFVLDYLENSGAANNTLVIFSSDNGARDEAGGRNANRPLKGVKGMLHEGGIRVPMVVRWPGVVSPGSVSHEPVTQLDWFPTLLEAAGHPVLDEIDADGSSIVSILGGVSLLPERDLFWHFPSYLAGWGFQRVDARQTPATVLRR